MARAPTLTAFFEGESRTVAEIHAMIPAISKKTLRQWINDGRMPATKTAALARPKQVHPPASPQQRRGMTLIAANTKTRRAALGQPQE